VDLTKDFGLSSSGKTMISDSEVLKELEAATKQDLVLSMGLPESR
jgi:hypothetical protein